jgi:hypothetical protein
MRIESRKKFDGNASAEVSVFGKINGPHSTLAERFNDPIMRDSFAYHLEFPAKREKKRSARGVLT